MLARQCLAGVIGTACAILIPAQQGEDVRVREDQTLVRQIEAAAPGQNLGVLQEVLRSIEERADDPDRYATMVYSAFLALSVRGTADGKLAARLEQKYALSALNRPDLISSLTELRLVLRLRPNVSSTDVASKDELRTKVDLLFHAWRRMEQDTRADFNWADRPAENVSPPPGTGGMTGEVLFSGMDALSIQDPRLRAEYRAAIEKNRVKAEEYSRQVQLRNIRGPFVRQAEAFLLSALKTDPGVEGAVLSGLSLVHDNEARERVLAKIRSRSER